jgi:hypothetical protein
VHDLCGLTPLSAAETLAGGGSYEAFGSVGVGAMPFLKMVFLAGAEDGAGADGALGAAGGFERALLIHLKDPGGHDAAYDARGESGEEVDLTALLPFFLRLLLALLAGGVSRLTEHAGSSVSGRDEGFEEMDAPGNGWLRTKQVIATPGLVATLQDAR